MASSLRVDPSALCASAAADAEVAYFMSELPVAQSMTRAAAGLADLRSGSACRFVGDVLDGATRALTAELSTHSESLVAAAQRYRRADEDLGRRLGMTDCHSMTPP
ncbi:MAG: ESX-1 secretion-associated protein [Mycolicibacterium sp.]|nr:ESX-1 secretion-associated protein [Mycolicibacterium sp.]